MTWEVIPQLLSSKRDGRKSVSFFLKCLGEFTSALLWAWCFPLEKAVLIDSVSLINMGLSRLSVSPCVSTGRLCLSRNQSIVLYQTWYQICCCCLIVKWCPTLCDPMDCSTQGCPVLHQLLEHAHCVDDAIQPSHPLSSFSPLALNPSQHQSLFQWVGSSHQVAKVVKLQLQQLSFQWIFRVDFL